MQPSGCSNGDSGHGAATSLQLWETEHDYRGACLVYLTRKARERIARVMPRNEFKRLERALDVYAVMDTEGHVLTVGHRTERITRH